MTVVLTNGWQYDTASIEPGRQDGEICLVRNDGVRRYFPISQIARVQKQDGQDMNM